MPKRIPKPRTGDLERKIQALKLRMERTDPTRTAAFTSIELREQTSVTYTDTDTQAQPQSNANVAPAAILLRISKPIVPNSRIIKQVCNIYDDACARGEKLSYKTIAAMSATSIATVCRALKNQGKRSQLRLNEDAEVMLRRGHNTRFSILDISHFTGVANYTIQHYFEKFAQEGLQRPASKQFIKMFGPTNRNPRLLLTYRLASQIYEAADNGKPPQGLCHPLLLAYALEHRREEEQAIINSLTILYKQQMTTPYRQEKNYFSGLMSP